MTVHEVRFPRYRDDVEAGRRTLFHMRIDGPIFRVGDGLRLIAHANYPRCRLGLLTDVRRVRLLAELDADLGKLATDRGDYLERWDQTHPELPSASDPEIWRIEFRYAKSDELPAQDPPEWSLAV